MALNFNRINKIIEVIAPQDDLFLQDLINSVRDYEDNIENMDLGQIAIATGKQDLGGGTLVGITLELINDWRISFSGWTGPDIQSVSVGGGNLVATNQYDNNPILPTAYTQVAVQSSSSATIAQLEIVNLQHMIESQRQHSGYGDIYYWNPVLGDDGNNGQSPVSAVKTWPAAQALVTEYNDDIIFINRGGTPDLTITEQVLVTKHNTHIRGTGVGLILEPSGIPGPAIYFSGVHDCSLESVRVNAQWITGSGLPYGEPKIGILEVMCSNISIKDVEINDAGTHGVHVLGCTSSTFHNVHVNNTGSHGFSIIGSTYLTNKDELHNCIATHCSGDGYSVSGTLITNLIFKGNVARGNAGYGASFYGAHGSYADGNNYGFDNGLGPINDQGTHTGYQLLDTIAAQSQSVWGTATSGNDAPGTFGEKIDKKLLTISKFLGLK